METGKEDIQSVDLAEASGGLKGCQAVREALRQMSC